MTDEKFPREVDLKRLNLKATDVMSCTECGPLIQSAIFAGLTYVDIDCTTCSFRGTVHFHMGGGGGGKPEEKE